MSLIKPPCVEGSGTAVAEPRDVAAFNSIVLSIEADLTVIQGSSQSLDITAQEEILPIITTNVSNDTLTIGETGCFSTSEGVSLDATIPMLDGLTVSSSGKATGTGLSLENPEIVVSGSGKVNLANLTAQTITVHVSSSGSVDLTGNADTLNISVSSSGDVTADQCPVANATVNISGSGDVRVYATGTLNATISSSGNIYYAGSPEITEHITGSGKLIPID